MDRAGIVHGGLVWTARALYAAMGWPILVEGLHRVPATGPLVVAANHVSHLDPLHLGVAAARRGRRLAFLAKRELFDHRLVGPLARGSQQIPVDRGGDASTAITPAVEVLRSGGAVAVFCEGTISESFVPAPPRPGAARIALAVGAPIVPVAVWGGQRVMTRGRSDLRRRGVAMTVRFGAPVLAGPDEDADHLMARTWEQVMALVEMSARTHPQAPADPDDRWWVPAHLGGTAPTVAEGLALMRAEEARRRQRAALSGPPAPGSAGVH